MRQPPIRSASHHIITPATWTPVILGTDWPADMRIDWPVAWVLGPQSLTREEKEKILWKSLLGL